MSVETNSLAASETPVSRFLPPREAWLINPYDPGQKLETPVDNRGLVVMEDLIDLVASTVDPEYRWPLKPGSDVHHLYWHRDWYQPPRWQGNFGPRHFREIPVHKVLVPRVFHNWIHKVTQPPEVPSRAVISYRLEAYHIAQNLFRRASAVLETEQKFRRWLDSEGYIKNPRDNNFEDYWVPAAERFLSGIDSDLSALEAVPPEFQIMELNGESAFTVALKLGKICTSQCVNGVARIRTKRSVPVGLAGDRAA